jgi:nitrogen fixation negative regulator NifL
MVADLGVAEPAHLIIDAMKKASTSTSGAVEVRIERGSGRPPRWFSCTLAAVEIRDECADRFFDPGHETAMLLVVSDITRLREEQEKVRATALKAMLAEEEHTATLRESMSATLYQIEEPINVIASAVALMRGRGEFAASGMLESAVEEARRRMNALRDLTAATKPEPEAATAINLNEVVRDVLDILTPRFLASGITLDWQPEAVLPALLGSPLQLRLAVKSIIDNAIDAIEAVVPGKKGGRAKGVKLREIGIASTVRKDYIVLTIDDSGLGVAAAMRLKVFEPFFSGKTTGGKRLGMGLSRAQQILTEHGGALEILDSPLGGCRVLIELPVAGAGG